MAPPPHVDCRACPAGVNGTNAGGRHGQPGQGPASVLAMGSATPPHIFLQKDYPDFFFRVTQSDHMTDLKRKFERICERSNIRKRHLYLTEELLRSNPSMCEHWGESFDVRQQYMLKEIPRLGSEAAEKALAEWGRPRSSVTHVVFCSTGGMDLPGADLAMSKLLGLMPTVRRVMLYSQGCFGGGTSLRVAKDLAENNNGARVLVVCSEITAITFRGPNEEQVDSLVGQALFSDGAAALVVGADPIPQLERPWFQIHWAGSYIFPESEGAIAGHWKQVGLTFHLKKTVPALVAKNLPAVLADLLQNLSSVEKHKHEEFRFKQAGAYGGSVKGPNDIFWITHPGGPAILDQMELAMKLRPEKLGATRHMLAEYGNMSSASVLFIMEHMRNDSVENKKGTSGEGMQWGALVSFGPGVTCEALLLESLLVPANYMPISDHKQN
uniref:Chalcone isomerase n=1 Tax=Lindsaea orbiculata TaxID=641184 RepID=A0A4Y6I0P0_9MONI|nr:chalcone isomerase [Lindsaea orbiculata]